MTPRNVLLLLFLVVLGCQTPGTDIIRSTHTPPPPPLITPQSAPPSVLAFSLPGIPQKNIRIDQDSREIQVIIPTDISATSFPASITVTEGFDAVPIGSSTPYVFDLLGFRLPIYFYRKYSAYNESVGPPYTIVTQSSGPLEITSPPSSLSFETGQPLLISVKNYYDDAVSGNSAVLTNQLTGQRYESPIEGCYGSIPACKGAAAGAVMTYFDSDIPYGTYDLEIRKSNQRQARATGTVSVSKGVPYVYDDSYNPSSPGTRGRKIFGVNLIESDQIELLLKNQTGEQYTLKPSSFAKDGKSMYVDIPATIKPSQYSMQPIRKGQLIPTYSRIVISRDRSQPAFVSFYYGAAYQSPDTPVVVERGRQKGFTFVISDNIADVRLKLIPVSAGQSPILINVSTPRNYLMAGPDAGVPSFSIPQTTPAGIYKLVLQHIMNDNRIIEGEPFERLVEVR